MVCYKSVGLERNSYGMRRIFYLSNQEQVENYMAQIKREEDELQQQLLAAHPEFIKTAEELRERMASIPRRSQ